MIQKIIGVGIDPDWTIEEALEVTGLNFTVKMVNGVTSIDEEGNVFSSDRDTSCCRTDNNLIMGIHKSRYRPLQNKDFFEIGWSVKGSFNPVSAIGWDDGRRPMLFMEGSSFDITSGDTLLTRMTLSNSHDGSAKFSAMPSVYRLNSDILIPLRFEHGKSKRAYSIRHDGSMEGKVEDMKRALVEYQKDASAWITKATNLNSHHMDKAELIAFWGKIYQDIINKVPVTEEEKEDAKVMLQTWELSLTEEPTLWTASAVVAQHLQHTVTRRVGDWESRRLENNINGATSDKTASVFQQAMSWLKLP